MIAFRDIVDSVGTVVDASGVLVIACGAVFATGQFLLGRKGLQENPYRLFRQNMGRAILLGLEFLVAGDIIRTVVVAPTYDNVVVLGLIVLIRTFLSFSLQLEVEGHLPWKRAAPVENHRE
jgi:uncharacterized membrane protein